MALAPPLYFDDIRLNYMPVLGPMIPWVFDFFKALNIYSLNEYSVENNFLMKFFCHDMAYVFFQFDI